MKPTPLSTLDVQRLIRSCERVDIAIRKLQEPLDLYEEIIRGFNERLPEEGAAGLTQGQQDLIRIYETLSNNYRDIVRLFSGVKIFLGVGENMTDAERAAFKDRLPTVLEALHRIMDTRFTEELKSYADNWELAAKACGHGDVSDEAIRNNKHAIDSVQQNILGQLNEMKAILGIATGRGPL